MAHTERLRVAYVDVDVMDHVNNATYFTYMETARCHYYLRLTGLGRIRDLDIIVASQRCDYLRGLRYDEEFDLTVWPTRIGTTSFTLSYAFRMPGGEIVARAETVIVAYDYSKDQKKPLAPDLRKKLEQEMRAGPGFPVLTRVTANG